MEGKPCYILVDGPSANQMLHVAWTTFPSQKTSWDDPQCVTPVDGMSDNSCVPEPGTKQYSVRRSTRETDLVTVVYQDPDTLTEQTVTVVLGICLKNGQSQQQHIIAWF